MPETTEALAQEMRANPRVLVMALASEAEQYDALRREFGDDRVRTVRAPAMLAELGAGAAAAGYRPVLDFGDGAALLQAVEPILNAAAAGYRSGDKLSLPVVFRIRNAAHGDSALISIPDLLVACPATTYDAIGLLRTALRTERSPVLFCENGAAGGPEVPDADYTVPFGAAAVRRAGTRATVVSYGAAAQAALVACQQLADTERIDVEMIDLRTLKPFDLAAVLQSLRKTGRVLLCSAAPQTGNFVCELAMRIHEHGFDDLDAPIRRLCGADAPVATAPDADAIIKAIRDLLSDRIES